MSDMHNHSSHQPEVKNCGSDMCMAENREMENFSQLEKAVVANRVWETCKPGRGFTRKTVTVSAGTVQRMRALLQSDFEVCAEAEEEAPPTPAQPAANLCQCGGVRPEALPKEKSLTRQKSCTSQRDDDDCGGVKFNDE